MGTRGVERADVVTEEERKFSNGEYDGACKELADVVRDIADKRDEEREELEPLSEARDDGILGGLPTPFPLRESMSGREVSFGEYSCIANAMRKHMHCVCICVCV